MTMLLHCCSTQGQLCPTWQSYAGLPPEEGAFCRLAAAALPLAAKTKQPGFARWKCTPIGAALRLGFKGFRRFKRFRGCGIALRAMSFRISLREMETKQPGCARRKCTPIPACRRHFSTGKGSRDFQVAIAPLQITFACHRRKHVTGFSGHCVSLQIQFLCHPGGGSLLYA